MDPSPMSEQAFHPPSPCCSHRNLSSPSLPPSLHQYEDSAANKNAYTTIMARLRSRNMTRRPGLRSFWPGTQPTLLTSSCNVYSDSYKY
ncbi:hypothetical protein LZ554_006641 [Drepanopeziza brunnea f. sp. 'monogermtubi']|nr:hypothetical protein LZ554_006641 [Drepanopeziza brunnea f. sp. 'monogermtubi']